MTTQLLATKLYVPTVRPEFVPRPRLLERLNAGLHRKLTLLALISRRAGGGQGAAMGLGNTFLSLGRIVGPLWAGFVFDVRLALPYLSGAIILFGGFLLSVTKLTSRKSLTS
jgi:hypothetical protein